MTATLLPEPLEPGSPEWLQTISASQLGTILGLDPWTSAHKLWHLKRGTMPHDAHQTQAQTRGHELEPLILAHLAEQHPDWAITPQPGTYQHATDTWATANPDALAGVGDKTLVIEVKSVHPDSVKHWREGPPSHYLAQVQWQLHVLGLDHAILVMASGYELFGRKPREYTIERDQVFIEHACQEADTFRLSVAAGFGEPTADFTRVSDREVLRWKHPNIEPNPGIELPDELAIPWLEALAATTGAETAETVTRAQLLACLGDGTTATWRGQTLGTRRAGRDGRPPTFARTRGLNPNALLTPTEQEAA